MNARAVTPGSYWVRRDGSAPAPQSVAVVLSATTDTIDALTFGGMRSLVARDVFEHLWVESTEPERSAWSLRRLPMLSGVAPAEIVWLGSRPTLEAWPWNDLASVLALLPRVGLDVGKLIEVKTYGPVGNQAQLQRFELIGTYREPLGSGAGFPPFVEAS